MSKSGLKDAMNALQVSKPLRLSARAPTFTPPVVNPPFSTVVENPTQVENKTGNEIQTLVPIITKVENETLVLNTTEVPNKTKEEFTTQDLYTSQVSNNPPVQNKPEDFITTQVFSSTQDENQAEVNSETEVGNKTQVDKQTEVQKEQPAKVRRGIEQDSSVVFEARATEGLEKGYTRLPNSILMRMANGDLTRGEIKILLLIARFTISFQKKLAPLSKTVLERQSGLRGAGVLEALAGLLSKKLIVKEQGDQHRPNQLGLVLPPDWDQLIGKNETQVKKTTTVEKPSQAVQTTSVSTSTPGSTSTVGEAQKSTPAQVENTSPFKDTKTYFNKNSHSQLPDKLQKYFNELKPARKRESELKSFQELCEDYSPEDISECFSIVLERGIKNGTEPCHSPMAFLGQAIAGIFIEVETHRKRAHERLAREQRELQEKQKIAAKEQQDALEWEMKEKAFSEAFPDEAQRVEALAKLCLEFPYKLSGEAARIIGIGKWWETRS